MNRKIFIIIVFIVTIFAFDSKSEVVTEAGIVKGKVIDSDNGEPMPFANVTLHNAEDSTLINGIITNEKGAFVFEKIPKGSYYLKYTYIGYMDQFTKPFALTSSAVRMDAGTLKLSAKAQQMNELVVSGEKSMYVNAIDRKIFNVEKDMLGQSGVVTDLLQNIPSVSVDIEGNVALRGSENVMILINGKPTAFTTASRASILQTMQANSVERIEVITNPSARFKPDGTSGIINIVTKKNSKSGLNGAVIANVGNHWRYNSSISANYKKEKININGGYGYRLDDRARISNEIRDFYGYDDITKTSTYKQTTSVSSTENTRPVSHNASLGVDYEIDQRNQLSLSGSFNTRNQERNAPTDYITDSLGTVLEKYSRNRLGNEPESEWAGTLQYSHNFKKEGHLLEINNEFQQGSEYENFKYTNDYLLPVAYKTFENTSLKQNVNQNDLEINYTNPLTKEIELEAGYNMVFESRDMPFFDEYRNSPTGAFTKDTTKSNHFNYNQLIHAFYATYAQEVRQFSFMLGLRAEKATIQSNLKNFAALGGDSIVPNNYFSLFPTLHLKYEINKNNEAQLNYSRRVNRPESDDLNPFPEYRELNAIRSGNPMLKPEYTDAIEASFLSRNDISSIQGTLYYRRKTGGFSRYEYYDEVKDIIYSTYANLKTDYSTGLEFIYNTNIAKKVNSNLSVNAFYNQFDASNIGLSSNQGNWVWSAKLNTSATVSPTTMVQFNASYMAPRLTAQGKYLERYGINLGARQDIFKKKASVILTISDLLNSMKDSYNTNLPTLKKYGERRRDARVVYVGFVYRFGQTQKKGKEDAIQFDDKL